MPTPYQCSRGYMYKLMATRGAEEPDTRALTAAVEDMPTFTFETRGMLCPRLRCVRGRPS